MSQLRELRVPELRLPTLQAEGPDDDADEGEERPPPTLPRGLLRGHHGLLAGGLPPAGLGALGHLAGPAGGPPGVAGAPGAGLLTLPSPGVPRRRHSWICR